MMHMTDKTGLVVTQQGDWADTAIYGSNGVPIELGRRIGHGGEGSIYEILGHSGLVAKLYSTPPNQRQQRKLGLMPKFATRIIALEHGWPVQTLHAGNGGPMIGFTQPFFEGSAPIHELFGPGSRAKRFPHANRTFLIRAAYNLATAISVVHANGLVVGDLTPSNVLVSPDASVHLIDCDSFQFESENVVYCCGVAMPEYAAPDLHSRNLANVRRTNHHDTFALAILIYQLLYEGRHPFSTSMGATRSGETSLISSIRRGRFVQLQRVPGHTAAWHQETVPRSLNRLFTRALSQHGLVGFNRPSAHEWATALKKLLSKPLLEPPSLVTTNAAYLAEAATAIAFIRSEVELPSLPLVRHIVDPPEMRHELRGRLFSFFGLSTVARSIAHSWLRLQLTRAQESSLEWFCANQDYEELTRFSNYHRANSELGAKLSDWESSVAASHHLVITKSDYNVELLNLLSNFKLKEVPLAKAEGNHLVDLSKLGIQTAADVHDDALDTVQSVSGPLALTLYRWRTDLERLISLQIVPPLAVPLEKNEHCIHLQRELILGAQRLQAEIHLAADLEQQTYDKIKTIEARYAHAKHEYPRLARLFNIHSPGVQTEN